MAFLGCLLIFVLMLIVFATFSSSFGAGIFTLLIIGGLFALLYRYVSKNEKEVQENEDRKKEELIYMLERLYPYSPTQKYITPNYESILSYDENGKQINFTTNQSNKIFDFDQIMSSEVIINEVSVSKTDRSSQLGGAIIGGALFGGVGAAIGGLSGDIKSEGKVKRIQLKVTVNDIRDPNHYIVFFESLTEVEKDNPVVKSAIEEVSKWNSIIGILIKKQIEEKAEITEAVMVSPKHEEKHGSVADELLKLSELLKQDFITKEEFELQKAKILRS